jgi:hypothetical protein
MKLYFALFQAVFKVNNHIQFFLKGVNDGVEIDKENEKEPEKGKGNRGRRDSSDVGDSIRFYTEPRFVE